MNLSLAFCHSPFVIQMLPPFMTLDACQLTNDSFYLTSYYAVFKVLAGCKSSSLPKLTLRLFVVGAEVATLIRRVSAVEVSGLEPLTSCLQSRRSTN